MAYYRRNYRSWRSRGWSNTNGPSKYSVLNKLFGDAVDTIKKAFLQLDSEALDELLADYGAIHGDAAQRYAVTAFPNWKSGKTKLSGQTMERLVTLVPPYLPSEQRFSILQIVIKKYKGSGSNTFIEVNAQEPAEGFKKIDQALSSLTVTNVLAHLPANVMDAAKWLYDDDITAARSMLAEAERIENDVIRTSARRELELLRRTIANKQIKTASYTVVMPAGSLQVSVFTPTVFQKVWKNIFG
jgi:hypothetical protein